MSSNIGMIIRNEKFLSFSLLVWKNFGNSLQTFLGIVLLTDTHTLSEIGYKPFNNPVSYS